MNTKTKRSLLIAFVMALIAGLGFVATNSGTAVAGGDNQETCYEQVEVHRKEVKGYKYVDDNWVVSGGWHIVPDSLNPPKYGDVPASGSVNLSVYGGPHVNVDYRYTTEVVNGDPIDCPSKKVNICHRDQGKPEWKVIEISENALDAHLAHQWGEDIYPVPEDGCPQPDSPVTVVAGDVPCGATTVTFTITNPNDTLVGLIFSVVGFGGAEVNAPPGVSTQQATLPATVSFVRGGEVVFGPTLFVSEDCPPVEHSVTITLECIINDGSLFDGGQRGTITSDYDGQLFYDIVDIDGAVVASGGTTSAGSLEVKLPPFSKPVRVVPSEGSNWVNTAEGYAQPSDELCDPPEVPEWTSECVNGEWVISSVEGTIIIDGPADQVTLQTGESHVMVGDLTELYGPTHRVEDFLGTFTRPEGCEPPEEPVCPQGTDSEGTPISELTDANGDGEINEEDCNEPETPEPTIDVAAFSPVCQADIPYIEYRIEVSGTDATTATLTFRDFFGDETVHENVPLSGTVIYPGASENPQDWPGWMLNDDGLWVEDPSDAHLRDGLLVIVDVNPTAMTRVEYPPATAACNSPENPPSSTVTPAAVTFRDPCGTSQDGANIPGNQYGKYIRTGDANGTVLAPGFHVGVPSVTFVPRDGVVVTNDAQTVWSTSFTNKACEGKDIVPVTNESSNDSNSLALLMVSGLAALALGGGLFAHRRQRLLNG